jgi:hypothetical protein
MTGGTKLRNGGGPWGGGRSNIGRASSLLVSARLASEIDNLDSQQVSKLLVVAAHVSEERLGPLVRG